MRAMTDDLGRAPGKLRVDGGAAANDLLMQYQSDLSAVSVERPVELESTARGAAMLAGIGAGIFKGTADAAGLNPVATKFLPSMNTEEREGRLSTWKLAVARSRLHKL
jgi:glycerol kinase